MFCPQCQKKIPDGSAYCPVCGRRFSHPASSAGESAPAAAPVAARTESATKTPSVSRDPEKPPFSGAQMFGLLCLAFFFFPAGWLIGGLNMRYPARKNQSLSLIFAGVAALIFGLANL